MLSKVTKQMMVQFIAEVYPQWNKEYTENYAQKLINTLDEKLDEIIYTYCTTGKMTDLSYRHGNEAFSILEIRAIRQGCSFLDAIILMDGYIKDPVKGRIHIMRR